MPVDVKMSDREQLPLFCGKCVYARRKVLSGKSYCRQKCKYNPRFRYSAVLSFFMRKMRSVAGIQGLR